MAIANNKRYKKRKSLKKRPKFTRYQQMAMKLQHYLFPEGLPQWMPQFHASPELMTIFVLLFESIYSEFNTKDIDSNIITATLEQKIRTLLQVDSREIYSYKVIEPFYLLSGEFCPMAEIPLHQTIKKARTIDKNNIVLYRYDSKEHRGFAEIQILSNGLFGSFDEDHRSFVIDKRDFASYTKYMRREQKLPLNRKF